MIGILGGSFDPIHFGHLRVAVEVLQGLELSQVRLVPSGQPPHRETPAASAEQRLAFVRTAVHGVAGLEVDDRELGREGPSYTVATLASLRAELGETPLCLIMGLDAFLGLPSWHQWQRLTDLAHIIVAHRPGWRHEFSGPLQDLVAERCTDSLDRLRAEPAGRILMYPVTQLEISSTRIRSLVAAGRSPRFLLPDAVLELIESLNLYRHDS